MFRKCCFDSDEDNGLSWWWLGIKVGVVTALILLWWWDNKNKKKLKMAVSDEPGGENLSIPLPDETATPVDDLVIETEGELPESTPEVPTKPDDLTKIEGIGPKINATLQEAGIQTFAQLAGSEPAALKKILVDAGVRMGYPDTWPEQAALAAKADWAALKEFQSGLRGGRRIDQ